MQVHPAIGEEHFLPVPSKKALLGAILAGMSGPEMDWQRVLTVSRRSVRATFMAAVILWSVRCALSAIRHLLCAIFFACRCWANV